MSDLSLFADQDQARAIVEAVAQAVERALGRPCALSLCVHLDPGEIEEVLTLQDRVFGSRGVAFDRRGLAEVLDDPEALFVLLRVDGALVGCGFGYWEWPDQITVRGSDFFLDTGMLLEEYRGHGVGAGVLAGMLLLAALLDCHRVGIAAWQGGANRETLVAFYRRMGFVPVERGDSPHVLMLAELDPGNLARWRAMLGLPVEGER